MLGYETPAEDVAAIRDWVATWDKHVDAINFTAARNLFDPGVIGLSINTWQSKGIHEKGDNYPTPGRATVLFGRTDRGAPWKGLHTHISLNPGTPQKSHGDRPETQ